MSRFPQPAQRLTSLHTYIKRVALLGLRPVLQQMQRDGMSLQDAQRVCRHYTCAAGSSRQIAYMPTC